MPRAHRPPAVSSPRWSRARCRSPTPARGPRRRPPAHRGVGRRARRRGCRRRQRSRRRPRSSHRRAARATRLGRRRDPQRRSSASAATTTSRSTACTRPAPARRSSAGPGPCASCRSAPTCSRPRRRLQRPEAGVRRARPGRVLVIEARGESGTGTVGDILALRAQVHGAVAIVTDGGVRDFAAVAALDIPTYSRDRTRGARPTPRAMGDRRHDRVRRRHRAARRRHRRRRRRRARDPAGARRGGRRATRSRRSARTRSSPRWSRQGHPVDGLYPMDAAWRARYEEARNAGDDDHRHRTDERPRASRARLPLHPRAHRRRPLRARLPARARPDRRRSSASGSCRCARRSAGSRPRGS